MGCSYPRRLSLLIDDGAGDHLDLDQLCRFMDKSWLPLGWAAKKIDFAEGFG
jgi:hypothetical protein